MGLIKFFKQLFKKEVILEVPTIKVEETETKVSTEKKQVEVITEKLVKVAEKKITKKKPEFPIEATLEKVPEKKKPRRRRKPKPKTDEGQA